MAEFTDDRAERIVAEAQRLLDDVQGQISASADFYRGMGIDPEKVAPALDPFMGAKEKEELARILRADQEAIQHEVDEAAARLRFAESAPKAPKARRPMV